MKKPNPIANLSAHYQVSKHIVRSWLAHYSKDINPYLQFGDPSIYAPASKKQLAAAYGVQRHTFGTWLKQDRAHLYNLNFDYSYVLTPAHVQLIVQHFGTPPHPLPPPILPTIL